jgi:hypothetical protein
MYQQVREKHAFHACFSGMEDWLRVDRCPAHPRWKNYKNNIFGIMKSLLPQKGFTRLDGNSWLTRYDHLSPSSSASTGVQLREALSSVDHDLLE